MPPRTFNFPHVPSSLKYCLICWIDGVEAAQLHEGRVLRLGEEDPDHGEDQESAGFHAAAVSRSSFHCLLQVQKLLN
jgi:hypothetical protein